MNDVKCPICGAPATLEESGWCFCKNTACMCAWSVMCTDKIAAVTAERDAYLETIRATFRVLESRGQAPDDNAPLQVTVRRVLDFLDKVTAERDSWRQVHQTALDYDEDREKHHAETVARLTAERDALAAQLSALKKRVADAPRKMLYPRDEGEKTGWVAMIVLEDGE